MLLITILFLLVFSTITDNYDLTFKWHHRITIITLFFISILTISLQFPLQLAGFNLLNEQLKITSFNEGILLLILTITIMILIFNATSVTGIKYLDYITIPMKEYSILILFNLIGLLLWHLTNDLISLFVIVELQSYSFYLITAFNNDSYYSSRAGLTYLWIAALASIIILFGCASLYSATGLTYFDGLFSLLYNVNF